MSSHENFFSKFLSPHSLFFENFQEKFLFGKTLKKEAVEAEEDSFCDSQNNKIVAGNNSKDHDDLFTFCNESIADQIAKDSKYSCASQKIRQNDKTKNAQPMNDTEEDLKCLFSLLMELSVLDESLATLFKDSPQKSDCMKHCALVQFRSNVARRLIRYSLIVKKCGTFLKNMSASGVVNDDAKAEYERNLSKLQDYKNQLSRFCSINDISFPPSKPTTPSVANVVQAEDNTGKDLERKVERFAYTSGSCDKGSAASEQIDMVSSLFETKSMMRQELSRMNVATLQLEESSKTIQSTYSIYTDCGLHLSSASDVLLKLKKRAEADSLYIFYSFLLFFFVCSYVILKRFGILRLTLLLCGSAISSALQLLDVLYKFLVQMFYSSSISEQNLITLNSDEICLASPLFYSPFTPFPTSTK